MEIVKSDKTLYGFTIKSTSGHKRSDYTPIFSKWEDNKQNVEMVTKHLEYGKHDYLHYHGIITIKKGFYRKRLEMKGYHIKLVEVFDIKGWVKYITKEHQPNKTLTDVIQTEDDIKCQQVYDAMGDLLQRNLERDKTESDTMSDDSMDSLIVEQCVLTKPNAGNPMGYKFRRSIFKDREEKG